MRIWYRLLVMLDVCVRRVGIVVRLFFNTSSPSSLPPSLLPSLRWCRSYPLRGRSGQALQPSYPSLYLWRAEGR